MGDQQRRPGIRGQHSAQHRPRRSGTGHVQAGQGFVEQQYLGFGGQRPGQCDQLCLTTGQGLGHAVGEIVGADLCQPPPGPQSRPRPVGVSASRERHVRDRRQVREQQRVLHEHPDPAVVDRDAHAAAGVGQCPVPQSDHRVVGAQQSGDHRDGGGLAGAVGPEDRQYLTGGHAELHVQSALGDPGPQVQLSHRHSSGTPSGDPASA